MEGQCAAWFARYLDLPAGYRAIAQNANALIIERMPFPAQIGRLEERELVLWKKRLVHWKRAQFRRG